MNPYTVMPACLDTADVRIVGFGTDYMLITFGDDCPGCVSGGGIERLMDSLENVNVVFITLSGSCGVGSLKRENHIWLHDGDEARRVFPETDKHWWKTQRFKSLCPKTFAELKQFLADGTDLRPVPEDTSSRKVTWNVTTGSTEIRFSSGEHIFATMPDGGEVLIEADNVKLLNWGYRYIEGMSPLKFDPEHTFENVEAVEYSDDRLSFIYQNRTYTISHLRKKATPE